MKFINVFVLAILLANTCLADSQSSESTAGAVPFYKKISVAHTMWLTGMKSRGMLDGQAGPGSDLSALQITSFSYKIDKQYSAGVANTFIQYFRQRSQAAAAGDWHNRKYTFSAPYLFGKMTSLYSEGEFSSPAFVRFYVPIDNAYRDSVGKITDAGYGALRLGVSPSYNFTKKLSGEIYSYAQYRFAKNPPQASSTNARITGHQNFFIALQPKIAYQVLEAADLYMSYFTGRMRHHLNGSFTHFNARDSYGESISLGSNIAATKKLAINPEFGWGPDSRSNADFKLNHFSIDLVASYAF